MFTEADIRWATAAATMVKAATPINPHAFNSWTQRETPIDWRPKTQQGGFWRSLGRSFKDPLGAVSGASALTGIGAGGQGILRNYAMNVGLPAMAGNFAGARAELGNAGNWQRPLARAREGFGDNQHALGNWMGKNLSPWLLTPAQKLKETLAEPNTY
jgi:hypothetical protein